MTDTGLDSLVAELRALGQHMNQPSVDSDLVEAVMSRVAELPPPAEQSVRLELLRRLRDLLSSTRRRAAVLVAVVALGLLLPTPVRAAVLDWFGFAGVVVRQDSNPPPSVAPPPPAPTGTMSLDEARKLVSFHPFLPSVLGAPQAVEVSTDRRVLSMTWTDTAEGTIRLDQFDGRLDYGFAKTAADVHYTEVGGDFAIWFDVPHEVVLLNRDETRRTETARLAGHTLIWERAPVTMRLEGEIELARAVEIADSATHAP